MANDFVTVSRTLVKRGFSDIEPKVAFALISGGIASVILNIATAYGLKLPLEVQNEIPYIFAVLGGYLTPSVGTTITNNRDVNNHTEVQSETHSGNVVSTITNSTPIQAAAPVADTPSGADKFIQSRWAGIGTDDNATQVIH